tara:strand:+ start:172 stop:1119 length:948 start_codon:yes stop_codon:yes gene_type:complete
MDLIEYLNSYRKGKKQRKKVKKGRNKIPRRARGYGQRGSKYYSDRNQNFRDNIDKQLLALLTALTRQNQPKLDLADPQALNPFVERDRQKYSMTNNRVQKAIDLPEKEEPIKIKETKALIFNISQDLDMRVDEVIDSQQKLLTELNNVGIMTPELAREFRNENLKLKEQVLSETVRLQELINDAEDLNDYRDIIKKQNKMIDDTTKGFVEIDNSLSEKHEELEKGAKIFEDTFVKKMKELEVAEGLEEELSMKDDEIGVLGEQLQEKEEEIEILKLTLERNELREQKLKQELIAMEKQIDIGFGISELVEASKKN